MASIKITSQVVELKTHNYVLSKRVSNSFYFNITQPKPNEVIVGCLDKKPNFGSSLPNWRYKHFNCQTEEILTSFEYDKNVSSKDFDKKWNTQYFKDGLNGFAIIGEERQITHNMEKEPSQTVINFEVINNTTDGTKGKILLDEGILPNQVILRYDHVEHCLNLVLEAVDKLKLYSFNWDKISSGKPLAMLDAVFINETPIRNWLGPDSISPDGYSILVYNTDDDYCQIQQLRTGQLDAGKFDAHQALFGTHTINWMNTDTTQKITISCYSGQLIFDLTVGKSEFAKQSIQNVSVRFANWKYYYSSDKDRTITGLQWRMPYGVRAQPHLTFELDDILFKDEYETRYGKANKSIPRGNVNLDATLMFENDFVAMFLIGARTVIGFDKFLQYAPVVYQLSEKFKDYTICAITQDKIYAYLMEEDDYEDYGYYGDFIVINFPYQFANRTASLSRFSKAPGIPFGAVRIISRFLAQQKKD